MSAVGRAVLEVVEANGPTVVSVCQLWPVTLAMLYLVSAASTVASANWSILRLMVFAKEMIRFCSTVGSNRLRSSSKISVFEPQSTGVARSLFGSLYVIWYSAPGDRCATSRTE
jgi:hypothetical protein